MKEPDLITHIRRALDDQPVDETTRQELDRARRTALQPDARVSMPWFSKPVIAFTGVALIAIVITLSLPRENTTPAVDSIDAFEILTGNDELEMYRDLEFYMWLESEELG